MGWKGWRSDLSMIWEFLRARKLLWLSPLLLLLLLLGLVVVAFQGSALAPFIYTLF